MGRTLKTCRQCPAALRDLHRSWVSLLLVLVFKCKNLHLAAHARLLGGEGCSDTVFLCLSYSEGFDILLPCFFGATVVGLTPFCSQLLQDLKRNKKFLLRLCSEFWRPNLITPFAHAIFKVLSTTMHICTRAIVSKGISSFGIIFYRFSAIVWFCIGHSVCLYSRA
jgi:hypothetical protein